MAAPGADLLHPAGWLAVAAAAAKTAAANPGRLFKVPQGVDVGIGADLITMILRQASAAFAAASQNNVPPVVVGPVLEEVIVGLLALAAKRRLTQVQVTTIEGLLETLMNEAMKLDGRILPGEIADRVSAAVFSLLTGELAAGMDIDAILTALRQHS
jgi:hypothetical protein